MRYLQLRKYDAANGTGIATSIFLSGCRFMCEGCFNRWEGWSFQNGKLITDEVIDQVIEYFSDPHVNHLSLLGGEPLHQNLEELNYFLEKIRNKIPNKPIWMWTGYYLKELEESRDREDILRLHLTKRYIDYVIDGRFEKDLKDERILFRGSTNQTIYKKERGVFIPDQKLNDFRL